MTVIVRVSETQQGHWLDAFVERLSRDEGKAPVALAHAVEPAWPRSVRLRMALERRAALNKAGSDRPRRTFADGSEIAAATLLIDFGPEGGPSPAGARHLAVLFDGARGAAPVIGALLAGSSPLIEVVDLRSGVVLARGEPCVSDQTGLLEACEAVFRRAGLLVAMALRRPEPGPQAARVATRVPVGAASLVAFSKFLLGRIIRLLYKSVFYSPHWRVGWRFVPGEGVFERGDLAGGAWTTLKDPGSRFYADPFPFSADGRHYIFFEDLPHAMNKGVISYVEIGPSGPLGPVRPVIEEPWHLSYPQLIEDEGQIYMLPEAHQSGGLMLYRAERFPDRWVKACDLVSGIDLHDATIVRFEGRWWMFATTTRGGGSWSDTLVIYMADALTGPWTAHPANPLLVDQRAARSAGPCVVKDGRLWRVTQDCSRGYGSGLGFVEVLRLDATGYQQELRATLGPGASWPGRRLHTLARAGQLECIDGSAISPKSRLLARLFFADRCGAHSDLS